MNKTELEILSEFNNLKPDLKKWGDIVVKTISSSLSSFEKENKIKLGPEYRLKDDRSYINKALYRRKEYNNPIHDIEDKIGVRIVLINTDDVHQAYDLLKSYDGWSLNTSKNIRDLIEEKPNQFDYQSIHVIVRPLSNSTDFDQGKIPLLSCEIQIRSLLQHAYAEVCHDTTYKGLYRNDKHIIRQLAKSMALMETVDDYFCNIFKLMSDSQREIKIFIEELIRIFSEIRLGFNKSDIDYELTEDFLSLLDLKDITIEQIDNFIIKSENEIDVIKESNDYLFKQPVILLIAYYFKYHRSFIHKEWPISDKLLKSVYFNFGVSYPY